MPKSVQFFNYIGRVGTHAVVLTAKMVLTAGISMSCPGLGLNPPSPASSRLGMPYLPVLHEMLGVVLFLHQVAQDTQVVSRCSITNGNPPVLVDRITKISK